MPRATLWFYLRDHGEDMRKWDGVPASDLEARVWELWGKTAANKDPSKKITAPVAVEQFPRHSRWAEDTSPPSDTDPMDVCPRGLEPHAWYHERTMPVSSGITPVKSHFSIAWATHREAWAPFMVKRLLVCNYRSQVMSVLIRNREALPPAR